MGVREKLLTYKDFLENLKEINIIDLEEEFGFPIVKNTSVRKRIRSLINSSDVWSYILTKGNPKMIYGHYWIDSLKEFYLNEEIPDGCTSSNKDIVINSLKIRIEKLRKVLAVFSLFPIVYIGMLFLLQFIKIDVDNLLIYSIVISLVVSGLFLALLEIFAPDEIRHEKKRYSWNILSFRKWIEPFYFIDERVTATYKDMKLIKEGYDIKDQIISFITQVHEYLLKETKSVKGDN